MNYFTHLFTVRLVNVVIFIIFLYDRQNWLGQVNYYNGHIVGRLGKFKKIYESYYYIRLVDIDNPNLLSWQKFDIK